MIHDWCQVVFVILVNINMLQMIIVSSDRTRTTPGFRLLQRNRPMRLQLARPRRQFCSRELRGTKPVRRQTSLILANFSQLESSLSPQQQHSTHSLYLSSKTVVSCVCTCTPSPRLLSCSRLYLSFLCSRWPYGRRGSGPLLSLSLSLIVLKVCLLVISEGE